jgi:hypothetical protein
MWPCLFPCTPLRAIYDPDERVKAVVTGSYLTADKYLILKVDRVTPNPDEINGLMWWLEIV